MFKRMRSLRLIAGLLAMLLLVLFMSASQADARGGRWSGIDDSVPVYTLTNELAVNGHVLNAEVKFPQLNACSLSDVFVTVDVPKGTDVTLTSEGSGTFDCHDGSFATLRTHTSINYAKVKGVRVSAMVVASETFSVSLSVYKNGAMEQVCSGESNQSVTCSSVSFDADSSDSTTEGSGGTTKKGGGKPAK